MLCNGPVVLHGHVCTSLTIALLFAVLLCATHCIAAVHLYTVLFGVFCLRSCLVVSTCFVQWFCLFYHDCMFVTFRDMCVCGTVHHHALHIVVHSFAGRSMYVHVCWAWWLHCTQGMRRLSLQMTVSLMAAGFVVQDCACGSCRGFVCHMCVLATCGWLFWFSFVMLIVYCLFLHNITV